ncbi:hypothetical protein F503_01401 [Ophiostoma piceae UAMH 11346]|uniref:Uncharacterized protein n=1 Tax=Ophiostoma piceae (strain UAMH 11346) TaxID=1262450 RepID=S3BV51_OPHP1|nr:hypothetical protein F503_01401 [Ophiostoma piceae UAMH 11346]
MVATREERGNQLVQRLGDAGIVLVEWDGTHLIRLGFPLFDTGSQVYFVPDEDLTFVRDAAAELDMLPLEKVKLKHNCANELSETSLRYLIDEREAESSEGFGPIMLLIFAPLSWSGIRLDELMALDQFTFEPRTPRHNPCLKTPEFVKTISIASTCAALIRIMAKIPRKSDLRTKLLCDLKGIVAYCLFDMSYEGMCMDIPGNDVPLSDKEKQDIEVAVADIQAWPFREDEIWMQDFMIKAVRSERKYDELPALEDAASGNV